MELLTIITFLTGIGLLIWGYFVGVENRLHLIPPSCTMRVIDSAGLTRWTGYNMMVTGTLGLIDGLLQYLVPATHTVIGVAYFVVIIPIMTVKIIRGLRKFREMV